MPWFFIPAIIAGGIALITLAVITIKKIRKWINENKTGIGKEKVMVNIKYNVVYLRGMSFSRNILEELTLKEKKLMMNWNGEWVTKRKPLLKWRIFNGTQICRDKHKKHTRYCQCNKPKIIDF